MSGEPECPFDILTALPSDLQSRVLQKLDHQELSTISSVSKAWKAATDADTVWDIAIIRSFGPGTVATVAALQGRSPFSSKKDLYRALTLKHTCRRCKKEFSDGNNTPESCSFHPGVLFSGGQLNGTALRFTCCSRRAHHIEMGSIGRDSNGCKTDYHADGFGMSAWSKLDSAAALQCSKMQVAKGGASLPMSTLVDHGYVTGRGLIEWHPDHRPGVSIVPSRLLTSMQ